ncbi:hypothetical protein J2S05_002753 [Alkalicoccobacillus murimartini]|uniref:Uncharacterized protein n=1 Tax=Alkalicoccobacillus murimartini TaxID=171685 RepID=A0ABT9YLP1_9BACI|nr:hypothetical protein [Alkalicoccobacillus murimartini]
MFNLSVPEKMQALESVLAVRGVIQDGVIKVV